MEALGKLAGGLILFTLSTLIFGWAFTTVWGWYIVPAFHVAALKFKTAVGISYISGFLNIGMALAADKRYGEMSYGLKAITGIVATLLLFLFAGFWFVALP